LQSEFEEFYLQNGLFFKAGFKTESWNLVLKENFIVEGESDSDDYNSYHFAIIADFIRQAN